MMWLEEIRRAKQAEQELENWLERLADKVESGELTREEIVDRLRVGLTWTV